MVNERRSPAVALVAGVGPGLGRQVIDLLVAQGTTVVAGSRSGYAEVAAAELAETGLPGTVLPVGLDLSEPQSCRAFVQRAVDEFGAVDALICTGRAVDPGVAFAEADLVQWRAVTEANLFGALELAQACVRPMRARGGSIVFVSSMVARRYASRQGAYAISKSALITAGQVLAVELGEDQIRVNTVVPGWMSGPSTEKFLTAEAARTSTTVARQQAAIARRIPLGRIPLDTEVADVIVYLASDRATALTGQAIHVNGGEYCGP